MENKFRGEGNALKVKAYIGDHFQPLTWNLIALKCIKTMAKKKVSPTNLDANSEFDEQLPR